MKKKGKKNIWKYIILIILIVGVGILFLNSNEKVKLQVKSWDNIYNENNIKMYYGESDDKKIKQLDEVYGVQELVLDEESEINKVLKVIDIVNRIVEFDDVLNSQKVNGYDILHEKGELKKVSQIDMSIIARDLILSTGIKARNGEYKSTKGNSYFVVEYWSNEYDKWIMIDFRDRGYITNKGVPCSSIEIINYPNKNMKYIGKVSSKQYIKELKKTSDTYSISIDNSVNKEKSNSYITYVKDKKYIDINNNNQYIPPTIFTENEELFKVNPSSDKIGVDEKLYMILMKKENEKDDSGSVTGKYIVGGFKDSKIVDKYFIKHNNSEFISVKKYYDLELVEGNNTIEISLDGINVSGSIELEY